MNEPLSTETLVARVSQWLWPLWKRKSYWLKTPHSFCRTDGNRWGACHQCGKLYEADIHE